MALIVQKYGGTSVGTPERIKNVARRILATQAAGNQVIAVVSAMSGVTDGLLKLARDVSPNPTDRELDVLLGDPDRHAWPTSQLERVPILTERRSGGHTPVARMRPQSRRGSRRSVVVPGRRGIGRLGVLSGEVGHEVDG